MTTLTNLKYQITCLNARIDALQHTLDADRKLRGQVRKKIAELQSKTRRRARKP